MQGILHVRHMNQFCQSFLYTLTFSLLKAVNKNKRGYSFYCKLVTVIAEVTVVVVMMVLAATMISNTNIRK